MTGPGSRQAAIARQSARAAWCCTAAALGAVAGACTEYEPASDRLPGGVTEELSPGGSGDGWACLSENTAPPAPPVFSGNAPRVVFSVQVVDLSTGQIYPEAEVRACGIADINCERPVTEWLGVDAEGWVDLPLFQDFTGFLEITSPETVPYLFFLTEPLDARSTIEYPLGIISLESLGPLVQLLGVEYREGTGVIAARSFDCNGETSSGVSLVGQTNGVPWYFVGGLPTGAGRATDAEGVAGYVNVPPGLAVFDAQAPNGLSIAGSQSLLVRPGWLSAVHLRPPARQRAAD